MRSTADFLARHREYLDRLVADDRIAWVSMSPGSLSIDLAEEKNERETMREIRSALRAGRWDKDAYQNSFALVSHRTDDEPVSIRINGHRDQVCTAKVVGQETKTIAAVEAKPERTEVVDVIEWECGTLLGDDEVEEVEVPA